MEIFYSDGFSSPTSALGTSVAVGAATGAGDACTREIVQPLFFTNL
jgi:hypothetical protein